MGHPSPKSGRFVGTPEVKLPRPAERSGTPSLSPWEGNAAAYRCATAWLRSYSVHDFRQSKQCIHALGELRLHITPQ